ncbi:MAG: hypothetical protein QXN37_03215, partial [Candidatus Anstonellaceae archaeon]
MRLVLSLLSKGGFSRQEFERKYRCAMHGLIHSCLSSSVFKEVQDIRNSGDPGLFTFSTLSGKFGPKGDILPNQSYKLSISSPYGPLFFSLVLHFKRMHISKKMLTLGDSAFSIESLKDFTLSLKPGDTIISDGPVILTTVSEKSK